MEWGIKKEPLKWGKNKREKDHTTELPLEEMNFIRSLRDHLPLRGKVKHP